MLECRDIDGLMMDWLYEELDSSTSAPFDAHVDGCARCRGELDSLARTRDAMRAFPMEEPPTSITAILMHEAAKRSPRAPVRAAAVPLGDDTGRRGFFGWLASLLDPIVAHPAATAMATLVLVAGVAGSMYLRGGHRISTPQVASQAEAPPALEADRQHSPAAAPEPTARMPETVEEAEDGYAVDLAPSMMDPTLAGEVNEKGRNSDDTTGKDKLGKSARDEFTEQQQKKEKKTLPVTTNAVSGADPLIDSEADGDVFEMKVGGELGNGAAVPPPPPKQDAAKSPVAVEKPPTRGAAPSLDAPGDAPGASTKSAAAERAWAQTQNKKLEDAARLKRCRDAAQIANDILDRNPDYYYQKVTGSVAVKSCSGFVTAERNRRARVTRSKAKPKSPASSSGSKDAKAAAQPDEASE
jgi:hypothetical protein